MNDIEYMKIALDLAKKGIGFVNPNPMVGAVIVKNDEIISSGYHEAYGQLHAERKAINDCKKSMQGATIYVTLEPCCHYGKTPPCTEAIIESGINKVVIGSSDPNPLVAGKGVKTLRDNGIVNEVQTYIAPKIFGGINAKSPVLELGIDNPKDSFYLSDTKIIKIDEDILIESKVIEKCLQG